MMPEPAAADRRPLLAVLLAALLAAAALSHFAAKSAEVYRSGYFDLPLFVEASIRHWRGEQVYARADDLAERFKPGAIVYKFPPPYLFHFLPWFDASGVWHPWFRALLTLAYIAIHVATLALACWLVLRCRASGDSGGRPVETRIFLLLALAFATMYMPFFVVQGGTSGEGYIGAVALLAFAVMQRWPGLAGFLLAWLACLKLYPAFLLLYPLLTRQWAVLRGAVLGAVVIALLSLAVFGFAENLFYLTQVLPILLREPVSEDWTTAFLHTTGNLGLVKVMVEHSLLPNRLPIWLNTVRLPFVLAAMWLLWRHARRHEPARWTSLLAFALLLPTMLVCLPNVFYAYYILLLFPALALAGYCWSRGWWGWLCLCLLCLSCLLVDDNWTYALAKQAGAFAPTPAMVDEVGQVGVATYLWRHEKLLWLLTGMGKAVPFLPLLLWCGLAAALRAEGLNRDRIPASSFHDKRRYPAG